MTTIWAVDRNDHDGQGYKTYGYFADDDARVWEYLEDARDFVSMEMADDADAMLHTWRIRPYEMDSSNAHLQELYGKQPPDFPLQVTIEVRDGVAEVTSKSDGVWVTIIDHDNLDDDEDD